MVMQFEPTVLGDLFLSILDGTIEKFFNFATLYTHEVVVVLALV